jgi:hypothetical protein
MTDASLYHLKLDSTAIAVQDCVELIARAAEALGRRAREQSP